MTQYLTATICVMYAAILLLLIKHKAGVWDYAMLIPASIIPAWLALGLLLSKGG